MLKEFKQFALKGNVVDLATGVIIGGAFGKIVSSLVGDIISPILGIITGKINFSNLFISLDGNRYETMDAAKTAGAPTLNYGAFITNVIDFLIIAVVVFLLVKQIQKLVPKKAPAAPAVKACPYCFSNIHIKAVKCPNCASELKDGGAV